jgi:CheY-like chemotaxis protein
MQAVLLIDDDEQVRRYVSALLRRHHYEVVEAADGEQGLNLLKQHPVRLIITDIIMPGKEGVETIRTARRIYPSLKIIAMSGSGTSGPMFLSAAKKLGADVTLSKPFPPEALLNAMATLLAAS